MVTGQLKGKTVIVGGFSPHIHNLPKKLLIKHPVIGMNQWPEFFPCDYYIAVDTMASLTHWPYYLDAPFLKFYADVENPALEDIRKRDDVFFFNQACDEIGNYWVPQEWYDLLRYNVTTATAAISLAIILGASEVLLYGVDFVGSGRYDGTSYQQKNFWEQHLPTVNDLLEQFQQYTHIYKLHPESKLNAPMWPYLKDWS